MRIPPRSISVLGGDAKAPRARVSTGPPVLQEVPRAASAPAPAYLDDDEVAELADAMDEPAEGLARRPVREVELDLADAEAGAGGVDVHRGLHAEARRERGDRPQHLSPQRPLAGDRRRELESGQSPGRPAREAERRPETPAHPPREHGDRQVAAPVHDRGG